jgi:hypothetical protein
VFGWRDESVWVRGERYFVGGEEVDERTGRVVDAYLDRQTELGSFEFAAQVREMSDCLLGRRVLVKGEAHPKRPTDEILEVFSK